MSTVLMRVYPTDRYPFERCEPLARDEARRLTKAIAPKPFQKTKPGRVERWDCSQGCRSIVTDDNTYRQLSTTCAKHRGLIPPKEA